MNLQQSSNGMYTTDGDMTFLQPGKTWVVLIPLSPTGRFNPNTALNATEYQQIESQGSVLQISPSSDTVTLEFNQFAVKLGVALGSFSILLLQPLIVDLVIVPKEDKRE